MSKTGGGESELGVMGGGPGTGIAPDAPATATAPGPYVAGTPDDLLEAARAADGSESATADGSDQTPTKSLIEQEEETFYSSEDNKHGDDNIWGLLSGVGGNIYEWYDFAVYGLLATEIGAAFFPDSSKELQLIQSFGVYLAAFLMRPLGAIVFGEVGDRIAGRKNALVMSIIMITVPSVSLGILPSYRMWGPVAPILLVLLRIVQGLSVGGQLAGSYVLSIEQSSTANRGFRGSICDASSVGGFLLASGVTTVVRHIIPKDQMEIWGWRIPFLFSLLIAPVLYHVVKQTEESKFWAERAEQKETEKIIRENEAQQSPAVWDLLSSPFRRRQLMGMVGVMSAKASTFYMLFLWSPVYLANIRGVLTEAEADLIGFVVVGIYVFLLLLGGKLSDSFPHRKDLIRIGVPGVIVGAPTMFGMFESESWYGVLLGQLQLAICLSFIQGGIAAWEVELWMADPTLSFTGVAVGHNLTASIFGGTLPLIATFLAHLGDKIAGEDNEDALLPRLIPGLYISLLGFLSLFCVSVVIRHPHDLRTGEKKLSDVKNAEKQRKKKKKKQKEGQKRKEQIKNVDGYWTNPDGELVSGPPTVVGPGTYVPPHETTNAV